jgi:hypothetical protein
VAGNRFAFILGKSFPEDRNPILNNPAQKPGGRQCDGSPRGACNLLRDLGFGDLGFDLLQPEYRLNSIARRIAANIAKLPELLSR